MTVCTNNVTLCNFLLYSLKCGTVIHHPGNSVMFLLWVTMIKL